MKTKVVKNDVRGVQLFTIIEEKGEGEAAKKVKLINFPIKKAEAILKHLTELKKYVKDNTVTTKKGKK